MPKRPAKTLAITWLPEPEAHNYPAAASYLGLIFDPALVAELVEGLRHSALESFKAKDIFRASGLSRLGVSNLHVEQDRKKVRKHVPLSPLLLVRDPRSGRVIIADGYHRLCAVYSFSEDALIPCKITQVPPPSPWTPA